MTVHNCGIYLISPPEIDLISFKEDLARALDAGEVACLQLRLKNCEDDHILRAAEHLIPVCQKRNTVFLVNDRPDLARRVEADGVHIGQKDSTYSDARKILGKNSIIGVTCHNSRHLACIAAESGADYVAFGAFFPSLTKNAEFHAPLHLLEWWSELMVIPCVAIGGITPNNCGPLVRAGSDFIAPLSAVWQHPDGPAAAIMAFKKSINHNLRRVWSNNGQP